jgi:hypothetical protein
MCLVSSMPEIFPLRSYNFKLLARSLSGRARSRYPGPTKVQLLPQVGLVARHPVAVVEAGEVCFSASVRRFLRLNRCTAGVMRGRRDVSFHRAVAYFPLVLQAQQGGAALYVQYPHALLGRYLAVRPVQAVSQSDVLDYLIYQLIKRYLN